MASLTRWGEGGGCYQAGARGRRKQPGRGQGGSIRQGNGAGGVKQAVNQVGGEDYQAGALETFIVAAVVLLLEVRICRPVSAWQNDCAIYVKGMEEQVPFLLLFLEGRGKRRPGRMGGCGGGAGHGRRGKVKEDNQAGG